MATLVYKMTHSGDPNPDEGCWGVPGCDCMGTVREWDYDSVIGIAGRTWTGRAGEIVWVGIGPHWTAVEGLVAGQVTFDQFRYFEEGEQMLDDIAPNLAARMENVRRMLYGFTEIEEQEIEDILELAMNAPPSPQLVA
jgi:hypothetical protein